jgi:hypothetical protein
LLEAQLGRVTHAIALSNPLLAYDSSGTVEDPFARSVLHLARARWFLALADSAAADRELLWYENSDSGIEGWVQREVQPGEIDGVLSAFARLQRARLARDRGNRAFGCELALRVRELWRDAEPSYAGLRSEADSVAQGCTR